MIGIVDGERLRNNKKKKKIYRIVIDVASEKKEKKEMKYHEDKSSVGETIKEKENRDSRIDGAAVKEDCDCYQSEIFTKGILTEREKREKSERRRDREYVSRTRVARGENDIRARDSKAE